MDRFPLVISTLCFLLGFAYNLAALKTGRFHPRRFNWVAMGAGFFFQTLFLAQRSMAIRHCPLTNLFEVLVFLSWSITLFYFVIGPAYRLSLLGAFTEPLVLVIQSVALLAPLDGPHSAFLPHPAWVEWHAALCIMAYGAFAMAGVAGVMYLAQERRLKTRQIDLAFYQLPPIADLATANLRLLWVGMALLTAGLASAAAIGKPVPPTVSIWGVTLWVGYLVLPLARRWGSRRLAILSAAGFVVAVAGLIASGHINWGAAL